MRYLFTTLLFLTACGSQLVEFPVDGGPVPSPTATADPDPGDPDPTPPPVDAGNDDADDGPLDPSCKCRRDSGPPACVPKTAKQACGTKRCVSVDDGCGHKLHCGQTSQCTTCDTAKAKCVYKCEHSRMCDDDERRCKKACAEQLECCYVDVSL